MLYISLSIKSKAVKFLTTFLLDNCDAFVFFVDLGGFCSCDAFVFWTSATFVSYSAAKYFHKCG